MPEVSIHGFETSNNIKVRAALGFKDIPYTFHTIDPANRQEILKLSGQRLTPVMVHGDRVLFDSAAIMRYLEANFPGRPLLFGTSKAEQWAIEEMELFARHTLAGPMTEVIHHRVTSGAVDDTMQARCNAAFVQAASTLGERLSGRPWLVGDSMTAADVTAAAVMYRVRQRQLFTAPPGVEELRSWEDRVLAFDRYLQHPQA